MAVIEVKRVIYTSKETVGVLNLNGEYFFTLEDAIRPEKIYGKTAIPAGEYPLKLTESPKFGKYFSYKDGILQHATTHSDSHKLILIDQIPNYSRVLIHWGNTSEHTNGCLLIGTDLIKTDTGYMIKRSKVSYMKLYPMIEKMMQKQQVYLKIINL